MDKWLDGLGYHRIPQNHLKPWNHILKFLYFDKVTGTVPLCNSWIFLVDRKKKKLCWSDQLWNRWTSPLSKLNLLVLPESSIFSSTKLLMKPCYFLGICGWLVVSSWFWTRSVLRMDVSENGIKTWNGHVDRHDDEPIDLGAAFFQTKPYMVLLMIYPIILYPFYPHLQMI